ncbi:MAG: peptide chain release factor N(5)-glutamine methyltransferase [Candidatus Acidiferrales bacterium]
MSHAEQRALSLDVRSVLREGIARLRAARISSDTLAAEVLLLHSLGRDRSWLYSHADEQLDPHLVANYFTLIARRVAGEPTQHLTGKQEFWGLEFEVTPAVLIPRPETEHVVEVALGRLGAAGIQIDMKTGARSPRLRIADVGTGSGCIAIALAHELPHAEIFATDISVAALHVARCNGARHRVDDRVHFVETDLLEGISLSPLAAAGSPRLFDLIVSNPPYVARDDAATLEREVREHEPETALFGGPTGIEIYARLIEQAGARLRPGGNLVLELGYGAADSVRAILSAQPGWANICVTTDLAEIPRVIAAERI